MTSDNLQFSFGLFHYMCSNYELSYLIIRVFNKLFVIHTVILRLGQYIAFGFASGVQSKLFYRNLAIEIAHKA